ncbi:CLUMA_CG019553, isoform A [Clunio marinus]|uniref:CLUMA_CG019553, isoform A n=1 Tax=Clunio marinus TaxID=568069 RepID=A0A1J1J4X1_9DIPT|nr:CLUMA_CG019553, isoform A [Clunio marinus]
MSNPFFFNNRLSQRRFSYAQQKSRGSKSANSMNFTDNFADIPLHNSTMNKSRGQYLVRSFSNASVDMNSNAFDAQSHSSNNSTNQESNKPSFSSLFTSVANQSSDNINHKSNSDHLSYDSSTQDDDGIFLQISNLDQWYDETNLRSYLISQLKPITPILSLSIETPSIAKVKVPSMQFAKQVVSHLHRKKMGHKRIFVSFMKDKTSAECSALRNKVAGLLKDVSSHQLPMSKFRELFQFRFKSSISILDLYRMPEICAITVNNNDEKLIALQPEIVSKLENEILVNSNQHSAPYCIYHFKADKNKGWAEIEIDPLPYTMMGITQVQSMIHSLLKSHQSDIPIASLLFCLQSELNVTIQPNDRGVSLEHLVSCVPGVQIKNNDYGIKVLVWSDESTSEDINLKGLSLTCGDAADNVSREVIELIKMCPKSTMTFSKFIPTYHNHFGKQCRVADYGCTKLIELFEAMSSIVQVLGDGESRQITLTHRTQIRRFSNDLFKILRAQPNKSLHLSMLSQAYLATHNRIFDVTDYGVCEIDDLLDSLRNNSFIMVTRKRTESDDVCMFIQKRRQTNVEIEKTSVFAGEVVELLRNASQYSIPFRMFVRSYHYYFGFQCKLSDYGFLRLAELLEALSGTVEMDQSNEENRKIFLSRKMALRVFSEQIQDVIKGMTGHANMMVKVDDVMDMHKNNYGYQMQGSSLGYESVIDALKFVPFVELNSFGNELWIVSHLENEKFRKRAMLACIAIIDIGNKVPLSRFHSVFGDRFKFNICEKTLHAMKHAVEIEMVNGIKMISISNMMKFMIHVANVLEQKKRININELKSIMKLNLSTTFNFGYPNISTLFQAFPDTFKVVDEKPLHERSEIELHPDCPFSPLGLKKMLNMKQIQMPDEKPDMFMKTNTQPDHLPATMRCIQKPSQSSLMQEQQTSKFNPQQNEEFFNRTALNNSNVEQLSKNFNRNNPFMMGDVTLSTTMPTDVMSQILNNSYNHNNQYQRFMSSNPFEDSFSTSQSFYERNLKFQQQQQLQMMKRDHFNSSGMSSGASQSSSLGSSSLSAYETSMQQQQHYSMMAPPFHSRFDPPKPDTPPSKPLWLDPVWSCDVNNNVNSNSHNNNSGNSEALKAFNFHVVSPFMSFKTMFTFDNQNQNVGNNKNSSSSSNNNTNQKK